MKLKVKITLLTLVPLVLMGLISYMIAKQQITEKMETEV